MLNFAKGKKRKRVDTDGTKRVSECQRTTKKWVLEAQLWNIVIS
jgi:hypothetical protein